MRLNEARNLRGLNGKQLAEKIGKTGGTVSQYHSGAIDPDMESLVAIADALEVSIDWLVGRSDVMRLSQSAFVVPDVPESLLNRLDAEAKRQHFTSKEEFARHVMRAAVSSAKPSDATKLLDAAEGEK